MIQPFFSGEGYVRTRQVQKGFCGAFCKKRPLVPAGTRRFFWELFFAPFVSKKSGVPNCALQNRCKPTEIKLSKPLAHFFFLKPKAQKEKVRKKKNAVWEVSLVATSDKACAALTRTHWRGGSYGCGANTPLAAKL